MATCTGPQSTPRPLNPPATTPSNDVRSLTGRDDAVDGALRDVRELVVNQLGRLSGVLERYRGHRRAEHVGRVARELRIQRQRLRGEEVTGNRYGEAVPGVLLWREK